MQRTLTWFIAQLIVYLSIQLLDIQQSINHHLHYFKFVSSVNITLSTGIIDILLPHSRFCAVLRIALKLVAHNVNKLA